MPTVATRSTPSNPDHGEPSDPLVRGRDCYQRREWNDAFEALSLADQSTPLGAEDLQRLAWSAGLTARDDQMLATQERTYHARLQANEGLVAARAAFWLGFRLLARGEPGRASGWLSRAQRLVELHAEDCVERGYLLLPAGQKLLSTGEFVQAHDCAARAAVIGEHFGEVDLIAFARNIQGRALLSQGQIAQGIARLDEAMLAATAGELSPVVTGIVYCSAIASCHRVFALDRVREWTAALSKWCDAHPQLGLFNGHCLVHRAEVLELNGSWPEAVDEARRAVLRCVRQVERDAAGRAHYQKAEIHRLRGKFELATSGYLEASRVGFEPQPGLALLSLAQGDTVAAASASRRIVGATEDRVARLRFLPAHVEIMLAAGDVGEARAASRELQETAAALNVDVLVAIAEHACGSVDLVEGNLHAVLGPVRRAFGIWQQIGAPYLAARMLFPVELNGSKIVASVSTSNADTAMSTDVSRQILALTSAPLTCMFRLTLKASPGVTSGQWHSPLGTSNYRICSFGSHRHTGTPGLHLNEIRNIRGRGRVHRPRRSPVLCNIPAGSRLKRDRTHAALFRDETEDPVFRAGRLTFSVIEAEPRAKVSSRAYLPPGEYVCGRTSVPAPFCG